MDSIKGRGPDNTTLSRVSNRLVLGFQRLRIVDTSVAGDQPMIRGNISLIANAEIYNFEAIKAKYGFEFESSSDCEILLHLYEKFGHPKNFIDELDGVFAFCIHDSEKDVTYIGRDPIGVRPIFTGKDVNRNLGFASESKVRSFSGS